MNTSPEGLATAHTAFARELIDAGMLIETSVLGLYGRSGEFEAIVDGVNAAATVAGAHLNAQTMRFPAVFPRASFERTGYVTSFPSLTGAINTFHGGDRDHAALLNAHRTGEPWDQFLSPAETMLVPAACHPVYALFEGTLPEAGHTIDVLGDCFRHEPSPDPARMQAFRMREYVRIADADAARSHRIDWVARGLDFLESLDLDAAAVDANDPFFGRAGRLLAKSQLADGLKTELVVRLYGDLDAGTAVMSCNVHRDHFGTAFGIRTADGDVAHSACVGFGLERIALSLLRTHGLSLRRWSPRLRANLCI